MHNKFNNEVIEISDKTTGCEVWDLLVWLTVVGGSSRRI